MYSVMLLLGISNAAPYLVPLIRRSSNNAWCSINDSLPGQCNSIERNINGALSGMQNS